MYPAVNNDIKGEIYQRANTVGGTFEYSNKTMLKNYGNSEILPVTTNSRLNDAKIRIRDDERSGSRQDVYPND